MYATCNGDAPTLLSQGAKAWLGCMHVCEWRRTKHLPLLSVKHVFMLVYTTVCEYFNLTALVVSCRTFGKGLIQSVYELSDGSGMVITNGKYLTPALTDIDTEGIAPDFKQQPSSEVAANKINACVVPNRPLV